MVESLRRTGISIRIRDTFSVIGLKPRATPQAEDCVRATVPGTHGGRATLRGGGHNAIRCCHFFRNRTMLSSSVHLWGFRERKQGLGCPRRMLGQNCRTRRSGQGIGGFEARNDIRSAVKRGRDTGRVGKADVRMSSPATQTLKLCCAWQFLRPCWPGFD